MSVETSILLPTASVHLFLKDEETINAARKLKDDWRFARVDVDVIEGGVEKSIEHYGEVQSPDLMIVETDTTNESFVGRLEALAGVCNADTNAVIVGPVNDIDLYRSLKAMGVLDYLVKPVAYDVLSEIIANALIEKLGASGSRLVGIIGAKGGVGASSLTQAFAWGLSENLDQKTFLMDAAGGWSSMSVGMGFEPSTTMHEAVRAGADHDEDVLNRMLFKPNEKLSVLASGADQMLEASIHAQQFEELLDITMKSYPVVLVDLSGAIPSLKRTVVTKAHQLFVVSTPTLPSLRATRTLIQEIKDIKDGNDDDDCNVELILNMQGMSASKEVPKKDISLALEREPSISIPFDTKIFMAAENSGQKLKDNAGGKELIANILPLMKRIVSVPDLVEEDESKGGFMNDVLNKLKKK